MAAPDDIARGLAAYIQRMGGASRRTSFVAQEAASNPRLQALLAEAATSDTPGLVFARISRVFEPPAMDRATLAYGGREEPGRRSLEQVARDGVAEELGPYYREAPMEQVNDAQSLLGPTMGGEDLVARLEGMTPRPLYAFDLPGDTSVRSQMDATYGPFAFPPESRGLIVQGSPAGTGIAVPGPTALSTQAPTPRRLPGPQQRRIGTTAGVPVGEVTPRSSFRSEPEADINMMGMDEGSVLGWPDSMPRPNARLPASTPRRLESPEVAAEQRALEELAASVAQNSRRAGGASPPRTPPTGPARQAAGGGGNWKAALAAGVAGAGAGLWRLGSDLMMPVDGGNDSKPLVPDITSKPKPMSTADLAAETSPPPSVRVEEPVVIDYSQMARDKIRQANEIQLREARITPESAALSREADALYLRAAEGRRLGNQPPIMPVEQQDAQTSAIRARRGPAGADPRSAARRILADLNAGRIPPAQRAAAQAEMQRLYRMADQYDNARRAG